MMAAIDQAKANAVLPGAGSLEGLPASASATLAGKWGCGDFHPTFHNHLLDELYTIDGLYTNSM